MGPAFLSTLTKERILNEADVRKAFSEMWCESLGCTTMEDDSDFFESGGTSITAVYLAAVVQERFGIEFDALEVVLKRRAQDVLGLVSERLGQAGEAPSST